MNTIFSPIVPNAFADEVNRQRILENAERMLKQGHSVALRPPNINMSF